MIGVVTAVLVLWFLLSLPIGLFVGRSLSIGTQVEARPRQGSPLHPLRSLHS